MRPALLALAAAALLAGCGGGAKPRADAPAPAPPATGVVSIVQDDAELLHRPPAQIAATLDDLRELGVDWVRVTAGWSVIAPDPASTTKPEFDATDPDAYPPGARTPSTGSSARPRPGACG